MRDIVVVPCYERPEFTQVCLEYLLNARGIQEKEVWLCLDNHIGDDEQKTWDAMRPVVSFADYNFRFFHSFHRDPHDSYGNSHNLIGSLQVAYDTGADRIFLVEDDIMVAPDIFEWHEEVLRTVDPFVSCATAVNKSAHFPINGRYAMDETHRDPNAYYWSRDAYSSHASAFSRDNLGFLLATLGSRPIAWASGCEQDICIQRMMTSLAFPNRGSAWPYVPRAFNVGFYSYHISGMRLNGTHDEKVATLREAIKDKEKLKWLAFNNQTVTPIPSEFLERTGPLVEAKKYR